MTGGPAEGSIDPALLEPVDGLSLEAYTELAAVMHVHDMEAAAAQARAKGVAWDRITAIATEWNRRMVVDPRIAHRYSELYQKELAEAGVRAPDLTVEQYASIITATQRGEPLGQVLQRFGLTLPAFAMVSDGWTKKLAADPSLAVRFASVISGGA